MQKFIDIHTHSAEKEADVWSLCNVLPEQNLPGTSFSIGVHPWEISEDWQVQMQEVVRKAQLPICKGIGECGLDKTVKTPLALQQAVFDAHIALANELQKPLVVHCVKAYAELWQCLQRIKVPVILHDFGKSANLGKQLQEKGVYLSVGKAVFRPSFSSVLPMLDRQLLFLETDDTEHSISEIYERVAQLFHCDVLTLQRQMHDNFKNVF